MGFLSDRQLAYPVNSSLSVLDTEKEHVRTPRALALSFQRMLT